MSRLVNELDDEKRTVEEQKIALEEYRKVGSGSIRNFNGVII